MLSIGGPSGLVGIVVLWYCGIVEYLCPFQYSGIVGTVVPLYNAYSGTVV